MPRVLTTKEKVNEKHAFNKGVKVRDFSGGPVSKTPCSQCKGPRSDPWAGASPVAQLVKNLPAMQETWVRSVGWEDPLEKGKVTHSRILAWRVP